MLFDANTKLNGFFGHVMIKILIPLKGRLTRQPYCITLTIMWNSEHREFQYLHEIQKGIHSEGSVCYLVDSLSLVILSLCCHGESVLLNTLITFLRMTSFLNWKHWRLLKVLIDVWLSLSKDSYFSWF